MDFDVAFPNMRSRDNDHSLDLKQSVAGYCCFLSPSRLRRSVVDSVGEMLTRIGFEVELLDDAEADSELRPTEADSERLVLAGMKPLSLPRT